jgi:hypothetical protein
MIAILSFFLIQPVQAEIWPDLSNPPKTKERSDDVALVVSIENYIFASDIQGAQKNGRDWYNYFTYSKGIPAENVILLEDKQATKENIEMEAAKIANRVGENGMVWFVYIGHGAPSIDGDDGLLLGSDVQQTSNSIQARGVSQKSTFGTFGTWFR